MGDLIKDGRSLPSLSRYFPTTIASPVDIRSSFVPLVEMIVAALGARGLIFTFRGTTVIYINGRSGEEQANDPMILRDLEGFATVDCIAAGRRHMVLR